MAEQIDELFVKLGLQQDQQQFDQAQSNFDSLRSAALQFGAVIGAGFGLRGLTSEFADATNELADTAQTFRGLGADAEFVDQLAFAFQEVGGNAGDAISSIQRVADLIEQTDWGEIPSDAFREAGFDPRMLEGVDNLAEAYERISNATQGMDPESARRALSALGFSDAEVRLFRDADLNELMGRGSELARMTEEMTQAAESFRTGMNESSRALDGISRELSALFVEDLGDSLSDLASIMAENRDAIVSFVDKATPAILGMASGIGTLVALRMGRAALGAFANVPGAVALAGGLAAGLSQIDGPEDMTPEEERENRLDTLNTRIQQLRNNMQDLPESQQERQQARLQDLIEEREQLRSQAPRADFDRRGLDLTPDLPQETPLDGGTTYNINVDARGATDPLAVEQGAERAFNRALARAAENTVLDLESPVS